MTHSFDALNQLFPVRYNSFPANPPSPNDLMRRGSDCFISPNTFNHRAGAGKRQLCTSPRTRANISTPDDSICRGGKRPSTLIGSGCNVRAVAFLSITVPKRVDSTFRLFLFSCSYNDRSCIFLSCGKTFICHTS